MAFDPTFWISSSQNIRNVSMFEIHKMFLESSIEAKEKVNPFLTVEYKVAWTVPDRHKLVPGHIDFVLEIDNLDYFGLDAFSFFLGEILHKRDFSMAVWRLFPGSSVSVTVKNFSIQKEIPSSTNQEETSIRKTLIMTELGESAILYSNLFLCSKIFRSFGIEYKTIDTGSVKFLVGDCNTSSVGLSPEKCSQLASVCNSIASYTSTTHLLHAFYDDKCNSIKVTFQRKYKFGKLA